MVAQLLVNSELLSANSVAMMLYHGTDFAARDEARFCCKHTKANLYCICTASAERSTGLQTGSVQACGSCPPLGETTPPAVDTAGISPRRNGRRRARTPKRMTRAARPARRTTRGITECRGRHAAAGPVQVVAPAVVGAARASGSAGLSVHPWECVRRDGGTQAACGVKPDAQH